MVHTQPTIDLIAFAFYKHRNTFALMPKRQEKQLREFPGDRVSLDRDGNGFAIARGGIIFDQLLDTGVVDVIWVTRSAVMERI